MQSGRCLRTFLHARAVLSALLVATPIAAGTSAAVAQGPLTPDDLPGDCNFDGTVDTQDLLKVLYAIGPYNGRHDVTILQGDANRDRTINIQDYLYVAAHLNTSLPDIPAIPGTTLSTSFGGHIVPPGTEASGNGSTPLTITDTSTGSPLVNAAVFYDTIYGRPPGPDLDGDGSPDGLMPVIPADDVLITLRPTIDGFDADISLINTSPIEVRWPGRLKLNRVVFGQAVAPSTVQARDLYRGANTYTRTYPQQFLFLSYPGNAYAPVHSVEANGYSLGLSIQYPILDYKQTITLFGYLESGGWTLNFEMNPYNSTYLHSSNFAPGEVRTYTISLRVLKHSAGDHENEWLRTLRPYRRWFRFLYGPVRYSANPNPVFGPLIAEQSHVSANNPYGFTYSTIRRIDQFGWAPWVDVLSDMADIGWGRSMLWAPTGLYNAIVAGYPPQFTSQWQSMPPVVDEMAANSGLMTYPNGSDRSVGLWWGQSADIADQWNDPHHERLDPTNESHRAIQMNELSGADAVGTTEIGLDAFKRLDAWHAYFWIQDMADEYPDMRFITEPSHCDIMHTIAPSFEVIGRTFSDGGSPYIYSQGGPLMDFLNPGREFWARLSYNNLTGTYGRAPTTEELRAFISGVAEFGFVPVYSGGTPPDRSAGEFEAAESWLTTVPADLQ